MFVRKIYEENQHKYSLGKSLWNQTIIHDKKLKFDFIKS